MQKRFDFGTGEQCPEKAAPGLERVLDPEGFDCEEECPVQVLIPLSRGECSDPARVRGSGPGFRFLLICLREFRSDVRVITGLIGPQRQPAGGEGEHSRNESGDEEAAAELLLPPGCGLGGFAQATLVLQLILLGLLAGGQERGLDRVELVAVGLGPLPAHGQARAPSTGNPSRPRAWPPPTPAPPRSAGAGPAGPRGRHRPTGGAASSPGSGPHGPPRPRHRSRRSPRS